MVSNPNRLQKLIRSDQNSTMSKTKEIHVVVIGAGFGGIACAKKLAENEHVKVSLVDRRNHHLFQPLIYQVASGQLAPPHVARSIRSIFEKYENVNVLYDLATDFDLDNNILKVQNGDELEFDYLVMATGAQTSFFGNDQWAEHVEQLKTLEGALAIREKILKNIELAELSNDLEERKRLGTVAIVGAGPTGVELSGAFADLIKRQMRTSFKNFNPEEEFRVILIEGMDRVLGPFDEDQSAYTQKYLEKIGVEVLTNSFVSDISPNKVQLKDGTTYDAGTIIWTAGVQATALTKKLPDAELTRGGLVIVNEKLQLPSHENVFIIGDTAAVKDGEKFVPGVAPAAVQGGEYAAKVILNTEYDKKEVKPFEYWDKGKMAVIGQFAAIIDVKGVKFYGFIGWLGWLFIHLLFLIDIRNMISVLGAWFWAYVRNQPGTRIFASSAEKKVE